MSTDSPRSYSEHVIVIAPTRRDGEVTCRILHQAQIDCSVGADFHSVATSIREGIGALIVTDIGLAHPQMSVVLQALDEQDKWSNLPVIALCREAGQSPVALRTLQVFRNAIVLERPSSTRTLLSAVRSALRGRRSQYRIRDQIAELVEAEEALRHSDRRKDEFLATLAHELRNPLAPIKTGLQLLRHDGLEEKRVENLHGMMDRQLSQLVKLIDELLEVSRISTGKVVLSRERLDMRDVIRAAAEACQPVIDAAGHRLVLDLPGQGVWVLGDAARLSQVVSNLINNAAKYTPNGGRIVAHLQEHAREAVVTVEDNGTGIPHEMLQEVFEMFTQVNRTLDRAQGGLGIGLSLVKKLVSLHGGTIVAESEGADRGSTFTVHLPAVPAPAEGLRKPADSDDMARAGHWRVLIVDDNADAADSLGLLLEVHGHEVRIEYGGQAGLKAAEEFGPEIVFCDIGMPELNGHEVASRLRRDKRFASTPLVALTGWGTEEDKKRARNAGFDYHLTKPAGAESLKTILAEIAAA
jgi:signal transduction histidine kinase/ActR/RegA family two-component response regulator